MNLDLILNLMAQYNLTADELLVVYLFFLAQREENEGLGHGELFALWYSNGGAERLHDLFESLKEKNIINQNCQPASPSDVEFNKTFMKGFMKHSDVLGKELWDAYPDFSIVRGVKYPWKNIAGRNSKFNSMSDLFYFYAKQIGNNINKHNEILNLVKWAKQNNKINCSLREFVISHQWEQLKKIKDSGGEGETVESIFIDE